MSKVVGHRYSVCWYTPYTEPPEGYDRFPLSVEIGPKVSTRHTPPEILAKIEELNDLHAFEHTTPKGATWTIRPWSVGCGSITVPTRVVPLKSKQRTRRKNLWKRCLKKHGIFVHEAEAEYRAKIETDRAHYGISELTKVIPCPPK